MNMNSSALRLHEAAKQDGRNAYSLSTSSVNSGRRFPNESNTGSSLPHSRVNSSPGPEVSGEPARPGVWVLSRNMVKQLCRLFANARTPQASNQINILF